LNPRSDADLRSDSANRAAEANYIAVGIGDGALPLAIILIPRAIYSDSRLSPLFGHPVSLSTVEVKSAVTWNFVVFWLGEVDRKIAVPMSDGIGVIVKRDIETRSLEPGGRAGYVGDLEDGLESRDQP
jgi:hypothetical protein